MTQRDAVKDDPAPRICIVSARRERFLSSFASLTKPIFIMVQALKRMRDYQIVLTHPFSRPRCVFWNTSVPPPESKEWEVEIKNLRETQ